MRQGFAARGSMGILVRHAASVPLPASNRWTDQKNQLCAKKKLKESNVAAGDVLFEAMANSLLLERVKNGVVSTKWAIVRSFSINVKSKLSQPLRVRV